MRPESRILRWISLLALATIGLHELRYLLGPAGAHHALSAHAHSYLPLAMAIAALLFLASVVHFVSTLVVAREGEIRPPRPLRFRWAWLWATAGLVAIFLTQESLEGALLGGHASGVHGLFGHGGWVVLPLAPAIGAIVAFFLRGAQSVIAALARRALSRPRSRSAAGRWPRLVPPSFPRIDVLACNLAGRAPPPFGS